MNRCPPSGARGAPAPPDDQPGGPSQPGNGGGGADAPLPAGRREGTPCAAGRPTGRPVATENRVGRGPELLGCARPGQARCGASGGTSGAGSARKTVSGRARGGPP